MTRVEEILQFWFGGLDDSARLDKNNPIVRRWFAKDEEFDVEIRARFQEDLIKAREGKYQGWEGEPPRRLALVLLFDQFSRNMYRATPSAFAADSLALNLTLRSIKEKTDHALPLIYRIFLYMPLMHSEDLSIQKLSLEYFRRLIEESQKKSPQNTAYYEYTFQFAQSHHDIIACFGRFPYRNAALQRISTPEEKNFLSGSRAAF